MSDKSNNQYNLNSSQATLDDKFINDSALFCLNNHVEELPIQTHSLTEEEKDKILADKNLVFCYYPRLLKFCSENPYIGKILKSCNKLDEFIWVFERAIKGYELESQCQYCVWIVKIYCYGFKNAEAAIWIKNTDERILKLKDSSKAKDLTMRHLNMKSDILCRLGYYSKAKKCLREAMNHWKKNFPKDKESESWIYINYGNVYYSQDDFKKAYRYYRKALKLRKELYESRLKAMVYDHLATLFIKWSETTKKKKNKLKKAKLYCNESTKYSEETNIEFYIASKAKWNLAKIEELKEGDKPQVRRQKLEALEELDKKLPQGNCLIAKLRKD